MRLGTVAILVILLPLMLSSVTAALRPKKARLLMLSVNVLCLLMSAYLLIQVLRQNAAFTVSMGEIGAPFGNELFVSKTEAVVLVGFDLIMLLSLLSGGRKIVHDISINRISLYYTVCSLLLAAMNALVLTNDIFTGYVFLEISTIAAGALIFAGSKRGALMASMRYMIMNLLGSGLFLFGLSILYSLTGELLFSGILQKVSEVAAQGKYTGALFVGLTLISLGLAMKSALFPFHTWLPNAYSLSTPASSSLLSSLVSKAYIFLYIKIIARGVGLSVFRESGANDVLLLYAVLAIVMGSVDAIQQHNVRRMISYSSVAQIGYIFLAVSFATRQGLAAAVFQIFAHSAAKAMLFPAVDRLVEVSGGNENFRDLRGSGYRAPVAGLAFAVGAFSIEGTPPLGGFSAKVFVASAAYAVGSWRMYVALGALAISTVLNIVYFLRTVVTVYRKSDRQPNAFFHQKVNAFRAFLCAFIALNLFMGVGAGGIMQLINGGINIW